MSSKTIHHNSAASSGASSKRHHSRRKSSADGDDNVETNDDISSERKTEDISKSSSDSSRHHSRRKSSSTSFERGIDAPKDIRASSKRHSRRKSSTDIDVETSDDIPSGKRKKHLSSKKSSSSSKRHSRNKSASAGSVEGSRNSERSDAVALSSTQSQGLEDSTSGSNRSSRHSHRRSRRENRSNSSDGGNVGHSNHEEDDENLNVAATSASEAESLNNVPAVFVDDRSTLYDDEAHYQERLSRDDDSLDNPFDHPMENPHFRARRPPAMIPGAVAIVRRGYEEEGEEWDPTAPSHFNENVEQAPLRPFTRTYIDATVTPFRKNLQEMSTTRMILYSILLMTIMGGVGAGIAIAVTSHDDSAAATPSPTGMCDFANAAQPDPILQCECNGNITTLNEELLVSYEDLLQTFIPSLYQEGFDRSIDSCEPQNVALLWLAMDEEIERSPESMRNRYLLSLLFVYWRGLGWRNNEGWLSSESECTWSGINCTDFLVTKIDLFHNNLAGDLVTELGLFRDLRSLNLEMNDLGGTLPPEIAGSTLLENLVLDRNNFSGSLPASYGELSNLKQLNIADNMLSGTIPTEILKLRNLEYLELSENLLSGSIPQQLGVLSNLKELGTAMNSLSGPLPPSLGLLTNLEAFVTQENQHTGNIPTELYSLTTLKWILVGFNLFDSGPLPTTIGQLANIESLIMSGIGLTGSIPSEIGLLTKLSTLYLFSNVLTGTIPESLGNLHNAERIVLHFNHFLEGKVPDEVCALSDESLEALVVSCGLSEGPDCECCKDCSSL